jgi:hypothetical protein
MSMLSLADLFRRGAVPSVEGTFGAGGSRERALENLQGRLAAGETAAPSVLNQALARIQLGGQRGQALERGETVPTTLMPVDPTLPAGTDFRYRVRVTVRVPNPLRPTELQVLDTVIPVDSGVPLSRQQIHDMAAPAAATLGRTSGSARFRAVGLALEIPESEVERIEIISAFRGPLA